MSALTDYLANKKILILGMGREGRSSLQYIQTHVPSVQITLADRNDPHIDGFDGFYGADYLAHMDGFDLVLKSPGIPFVGVDVPQGVEVTCQTDLFVRFAGCVCVGVTGTKGKTTTSTLI
ncbi:MAG: UDP-N-acetylmuramoyl-L-alanine--D-glutamate ligase, partial [Clostridia bacterium]|nr:UDP-N-acetylmuramoyl-L-alanine--D-glutamate ligase [Clostridia bacterium]